MSSPARNSGGFAPVFGGSFVLPPDLVDHSFAQEDKAGGAFWGDYPASPLHPQAPPSPILPVLNGLSPVVSGPAAHPSLVAGPRSRNWVFTQNNYTTDECVELAGLFDEGLFKYLVFGFEVGDGGTPHLQGFFVTKNDISWSALMDKFKFSWVAHSILHYNALNLAVDYCKKDGNFREFGSVPKSRAAIGADESDRWERARMQARTGRFDDISAQIMISHYGNLRFIERDARQVGGRLAGHCGIWICGPSGAGKSTLADKHWPDAFEKSANHWWCGYRAETDVILDDLDLNHDKLQRYLKIWAGNRPFTGDQKNAGKLIRPTTFVVTSQYEIEDIWQDAPTRDALNNRFEKWYVLDYLIAHKINRGVARVPLAPVFNRG